MVDNRENRQLNIDKKPTRCSACGGSLSFVGHGEYKCNECGEIERDDFGKIRKYLDEHGPSSAVQIAEATGVPVSSINKFLREGRVEIPEGSNVYITCAKCGTDIRYGRYCPACAASMSKGIQGALNTGAVPKNKGNGKMHYFGPKNRY